MGGTNVYSSRQVGKPGDRIEVRDSVINRTTLGGRKANADAYALRAGVSFLRQNYQKAKEDSAKVVELQPKNAQGWLNLGLADMALKRLPEAEKELQTNGCDSAVLVPDPRE